MSDEVSYKDADGNPCTLVALCRREPVWAASRHRVMLARIAELEAEVERLRAELEVSQAFHDVAVKERDHERAVVTRLKATIVYLEAKAAEIDP